MEAMVKQEEEASMDSSNSLCGERKMYSTGGANSSF